MRQPDYRTPVVGIDSVEHQARLLRFWETGPGLKGFLMSVCLLYTSPSPRDCS